MKNKHIQILILILYATVISASNGTGRFEFLKFSPSVRADALADSFVSIQGDVDNMYYNPAGVYSHDFLNVSASYTKWFHGMHFINASAKVHLGSVGDVGAGFLSLIHEDLNRVKYENGALKITDENMNLGDIMFIGHFSRSFMKKIYVGGNIKFIKENLDNTDFSG